MKDITIKIKKNTRLTKKEEDLMNKSKKKEWPKEYKIKNFRKDYLNSIFFFVKDKGKIVAFGTLTNLKLEYKKKKYNIFGICNIFTIKRKKGYGKILISTIIDYAKKYKRTALGFCSPQNSEFYKKSGLKIGKKLILKVIYRNPKTRKLEREYKADGVYHEGKDKLVSKLIKGKVPAYTDIKDW